jgi:hypothetical protein
LPEWIAQGIDGRYLLMRLSDPHLLSAADLLAMLDEARSLQGTSYDNAFSWSDDQMYCSELVWKIYDRAADIQLTEPRKLGSFDLSNPIVQAKLAQTYGDSIPLDEPVVAPSDLINSPLLKKVYEGE